MRFSSLGHVLAFTYRNRECKQMRVAIGNELYLEPIFNGFIQVKMITVVKEKQFFLKPAKPSDHKILIFIKLNILHLFGNWSP